EANTRVWDVASGKERCQLLNIPGKGTFAPDGKTVTTFGSGAPHCVQFFDAATGKETRPFAGHLSSVDGVAFSPDGKRVLTFASVGNDPVALLWDAQTGKVVREFRGESREVESANFS